MIASAGDPAAVAVRLRVLVATVAHRGDDARIAYRQISSLLEAGASVCFVAPLPDAIEVDERVVIRRSTGRHRLGAWWDLFREMRRRRSQFDVVLVHDLEAMVPVRMARPKAVVVWDVHEDLAASVIDRRWIPRPARRVAVRAVSLLERFARSSSRLVLAEEAYAERLGPWPVIPNTTMVPAVEPHALRQGRPYAIYVGRLSRHRGVDEMIEVGRLLAGTIDVVLVGHADGDVRERLTRAHEAGWVDVRGPLPNPAAMQLVEGALAGLCLLAPLPNYVVSMPTKLYEYASRAVPSIATPLPLARQAIEQSGSGVVVGYGGAREVVDALLEYASDADRRSTEGSAAYRWVNDSHNWCRDGERFVRHLAEWAEEHRLLERER